MSRTEAKPFVRSATGKPFGLRRLLVLGLLTLGVAGAFRWIYRPKPSPVAELETRISVLQQGLQANPSDLNLRRALAQELQAAGMHSAYIAQLRDILELAPNLRDVRMDLGHAYLSVEEGAASESEFRQVLEVEPRFAPAQHGLTLALGQQKRYREALASEERAVKLDPKNTDYQMTVALAAMRYAAVVRHRGQKERNYRLAIDHLEGLAGRGAQSGELFYYLGRCYGEVRESDEAIRVLSKSATLMPNDPRPAYQLARSYMSRADEEKALEAAEKAVKLGPEMAEAHALLGQLLARSPEQPQRDRSLEEVAAAYRLKPKNAQYVLALGDGYLRAERLQEALAAYSEAARLDPESPVPYQQLAALYTRLGKPDQAREAADAANKMMFNAQMLTQLQQQSMLAPRNIKLHMALARRYREINQPQLAEDELLAVLALDPKHAEAGKLLKELRGTREIVVP